MATLSRGGWHPKALSRWAPWAALLWLACSSPAEKEAEPRADESTHHESQLETKDFEVALKQVGQSRLLSIGEETSEGGLAWKGRLRLASAADIPDVELLEFLEQDEGWILLRGQQVPAGNVSTLPPVAFRRAADASIAQMNFQEEHDEFFQNVAQTLLAHALPSCRKKSSGTWRSQERDLQGTFSMMNRLASSDASLGEWQWTRTLQRYDDLIGLESPISELGQDAAGHLRVDCDTKGLQALEGSIRFSATKDDGTEIHGFHLVLDVERSDSQKQEITGDQQARLLDALEQVDFEEGATAVGEIYETERMRRNLLEAKMEGIEVSEVVGYSAMFETLGRRPEHFRTFKRAVALVQLEDAAAKDLADATLDPKAGSVAMAFLLDVLADAETVAAQAQLLRVLQSKKIRNAPELIQAGALRRLAFIVRPTREVVTHALEEFREHGSNDSTLGKTSALTLGSVVKNLKPELAKEAVDSLLGDWKKRETRKSRGATFSPCPTPERQRPSSPSLHGPGARRPTRGLLLLEPFARTPLLLRSPTCLDS